MFNKFEIVGILLSVGIMALGLTFIRFKSDGFVALVPESETMSAVIAVGDEPQKTPEQELHDDLMAASDAEGDLINLVIDDVRVGTGNIVTDGDTVTVHYVGRTPDGTQFDSSYDRGTPFSFTVGEGKVIEGWEKGLLGMKEGGERILVIPSTMAYGDRQVGPIKANSTLVFSIELIKVENK